MRAKRVFDATLAAILLLALFPVLVILGCLVWCNEPGPVLYRGVRAGREGRPFRILKFRTMTRAPTFSQEITVKDDPRVTWLGRWLRLTKLDELPQLINVLVGDMSLVGPRPEALKYVACYTNEQREVLSVRPGITGAAQVFFPHEEKILAGPDPEQLYRTRVMPAKLAIDLDYVCNWSFGLDLKLLALTILAIIHPIVAPPLDEVEVVGTGTQIMDEDKRNIMVREKKVMIPQVPATLSASSQQGEPGLRAWLTFHIHRRVRNYSLAVLVDMVLVTSALELAALLSVLGTSFPSSELQSLFLPSLLAGSLYAIVSYLLGLHRRLWRYASIKDGLGLLQAVGITLIFVSWFDFLRLPELRLFHLNILISGFLFSFLLLGCAKMLPRLVSTKPMLPAPGKGIRVVIVGAGQAGAALASRFLLNSRLGYRVVAFVDDDASKWRRRIHGIPILGAIRIIPELVEQRKIDLIAIALPSAGAERISQIIALCQETQASIKILQGLDEMVGSQPDPPLLREVDVADLIGRQVIRLHTTEEQRVLQDKVILVTGAAGSIGSELCRQLLHYEPATVIALDTNETGLFELAESLHGQRYKDRLRLRIGDITDMACMARLFATAHPHLVFHAAAYKHVPLLETHPDQALHTNVLGTYRLALLARQHGVNSFVFISSDKAAAPISILGASKRFGELVVQALAHEKTSTTRFCAVRFGNVIGSRGSVVPTFLKQIQQNGPVTVTEQNSTRYFMTIPEACGLVILAATRSDNGGLFLLDMGEPVRIADLAVKMIRLHGLRVGQDIPIVYTGLRPGERLNETLTAPGERLLSTEYPKILQIISDDPGPGLPMLNTWIDELQRSLQEGDMTLLRTRLLEFTQADAPVLASEHVKPSSVKS